MSATRHDPKRSDRAKARTLELKRARRDKYTVPATSRHDRATLS